MDRPCILNGLGIRIDTLAAVSGQESMRVGGHTTQRRDSLDGGGGVTCQLELDCQSLSWGPNFQRVQKGLPQFLTKRRSCCPVEGKGVLRKYG